ncbi:hypothetical protein KCP75_19560 [Salmonella enterica subsp. enterica]|nr:hypothetical protein KCP75_19560 [Salmonella enterica subsp. enterica]
MNVGGIGAKPQRQYGSVRQNNRQLRHRKHILLPEFSGRPFSTNIISHDCGRTAG